MVNKSLSLAILMVFLLIGCGGVRYSETAPEAKDFHPQRIGVLPVDVGTYEEARGPADQVIGGILRDKKWFKDVAAGDAMAALLSKNAEFRNLVMQYTLKLKTVNFSDPDLSRRIGEIAKVDAFLVVGIDYWNYTVENGKKVAKAGFTMKLIDASNGNVVWKAGHSVSEDYLVLKPSLESVARKAANEMISRMPH